MSRLPPEPTFLVTGAGSGIGAATVAALVGRGATVVATVHHRGDADPLRRRHRGAPLTVATLDVTDASACGRVVSRHHPDVLVNCAGNARLGAVMDIADDDARAQLETLVVGPVRLARMTVADQRRRGRIGGRIVNVSSVLASTPLPFTGWYGASKAALDSLTDALREELGPAGITVVRVDCGAVDTPAWNAAGTEVERGGDPTTSNGRHRWSVLTGVARRWFPGASEAGDVIARAALDTDPRPTYRVGFGSHLDLLATLVPTGVEDKVMRTLFALR